MNRAWILVGMMGAGKSAVGRSLAAGTGREFVDTDGMLQNRLGRPVTQLFSIYGEGAFRDHETALLRSIEPGAIILSTGGGIVMREANWTEMRRLGTVLYLHTAEEFLIARLARSKKRRPLLEVEDWQGRIRNLLAAREEFYRRADLVLDITDEEIDEVAARARVAFEEAERAHTP